MYLPFERSLGISLPTNSIHLQQAHDARLRCNFVRLPLGMSCVSLDAAAG